ncbi:MAG: methyltransferase domain-containing protein, partial [Planctomycetota bacterium]
FIPANAWAEHVPDGSLDLLVAANVLEHIEERRALLATMSAKLNPSGRLVISGPTENMLYRLGRRIVGFSGHYHVSNVSHVLADAAAVKLRRMARRRYPLPGPGCLYVVASFAPPAS